MDNIWDLKLWQPTFPGLKVDVKNKSVEEKVSALAIDHIVYVSNEVFTRHLKIFNASSI